MAKHKLDKETSGKFEEYLRLRNEARAATSAENRQKTVIKNVFKDGLKQRQFKVGSYILYNGVRIDYSATLTDTIEPEDFLALYESKQITREQYLHCISVRKGDVDTHVGSDISLRLTTQKEGSTFDVRVTTLPIDEPHQQVIVIPEVDKPVIRKKVKPSAKATQTEKVRGKPMIRRVQIKK